MVTNERTTNRMILVQACSWPVWESSLLQLKKTPIMSIRSWEPKSLSKWLRLALALNNWSAYSVRFSLSVIIYSLVSCSHVWIENVQLQQPTRHLCIFLFLYQIISRKFQKKCLKMFTRRIKFHLRSSDHNLWVNLKTTSGSLHFLWTSLSTSNNRSQTGHRIYLI